MRVSHKEKLRFAIENEMDSTTNLRNVGCPLCYTNFLDESASGMPCYCPRCKSELTLERWQNALERRRTHHK